MLMYPSRSDKRWAHNDKLLMRNGPLAVPGFEPSAEVKRLNKQCNWISFQDGLVVAALLFDE